VLDDGRDFTNWGLSHSVTSTIVNDGGTLLCTRKLDEVVGVERDAMGREVVRVQAGCRLKKLNRWLQAYGVEISFQSEIGEATVGSLATADSKECRWTAPDISPPMSSN
jgi:FAD/FMN-containing dehydrogenase